MIISEGDLKAWTNADAIKKAKQYYGRGLVGALRVDEISELKGNKRSGTYIEWNILGQFGNNPAHNKTCFETLIGMIRASPKDRERNPEKRGKRRKYFTQRH